MPNIATFKLTTVKYEYKITVKNGLNVNIKGKTVHEKLLADFSKDPSFCGLFSEIADGTESDLIIRLELAGSPSKYFDEEASLRIERILRKNGLMV